MDFDLSEEQRMLEDSVGRLIAERYSFEQRKKYMKEEAGFSRPEFVTRYAAGVGLAVLFFLDAQDIRRALVGDKKVGAVVTGQESGQGVDTRHQAHEVVLRAKGKNRRHIVVAHALFTQVHFETIGKEVEDIWRRPVKLGRSTGLTVQVLEGLQPGERIVAHPDASIEDGTLVEPR